MNPLPPLPTYDYLAAARGKLLDWVRPLSPADYTRHFDIGLNSIGRTLTHIMGCEWLYMERLRTRGTWDPPPYETWPIQDENPPPFAELEPHWRNQAETSRAIIQASLAAGEWDKPFDFRSMFATSGKRKVFTVTPAEIFFQAYTHEIHHRAQVMAMLRQLGIPAENLDPVYFIFRSREEPSP
jgi:uncharacterized damage-inducible protein DinB